MATKRNHGGKRDGAGRPPLMPDAVIVPVRFARADADWLAEQAKARGVTRSEEIRRRALLGR